MIDAGIARARGLAVGHRNAAEVDVLSGLKEGDIVILHPPNQLADRLTTAASGCESKLVNKSLTGRPNSK